MQRRPFQLVGVCLVTQKHLCACREDTVAVSDKVGISETSLRMQRRRIFRVINYLFLGNISAHAEKTYQGTRKADVIQKHLCACREDVSPRLLPAKVKETSLRMQRRQEADLALTNMQRNISAHAEKT